MLPLEDDLMIPAPQTPNPKFPHVRRYASIYAALWKNSVTREMMFKGNFILWIVVEMAFCRAKEGRAGTSGGK